MKASFPALLSLGLLLAGSTIASAAPNVDQQVLGPAGEKDKYVVSPRGGHLATISPKGSRVTVVVDGVVGPRFDDIVETTWGAIDPRPWEGVDVNLQPRGAAVTFSRDGSRYAYVARLSQEWVVMVDNKESFRIPVAGAVGAVSGIAGMAGNTELRMEFTGSDGKHLLLGKSGFAGYELWVDGQKWPGTYASGGGGSEGTVDPVISPDGEHVAYVAQISRDKRGLIVDGKEAGYFGTKLQYTPDSKHLISVNEGPKGHAVLIDGKQLFAAREIVHVHVPPTGSRLIFELVHFNAQGNAREGTFLLVDGKPVEATLTKSSGIKRLIISPDGKHYAAICGATGNEFVVIDGKKGQEYFNIIDKDVGDLAPGITFSPDSSKVVYTAYANGGRDQFIIINEEESDAMGNPWFKFSRDGKRLAYGGVVNQGQKGVLMIDGKAVSLPAGWITGPVTFTFSPEGSHYAFVAQNRGDSAVFLDGKSTEIMGEFTFSPDGKRLAIRGGGGPEKKQGLFVDGQIVFEPKSAYHGVLYCGFSADSQHLFWEQREPSPDPKAPPGSVDRVLYVDGVECPATRTADPSYMPNANPNLRRLMDSGRMDKLFWQLPARLNFNAAGKLVALAPQEEGMKRFAVTPAPDANVDTMIAEAKAAPARAAAKAAEEKKKAAEAAAAKKAKADADAAEAAAKAKADYDAQVAANAKARAEAQAKAKADYDARVAKQKADYDAAVAKRKADYDAAIAAKKK